MWSLFTVHSRPANATFATPLRCVNKPHIAETRTPLCIIFSRTINSTSFTAGRRAGENIAKHRVIRDGRGTRAATSNLCDGLRAKAHWFCGKIETLTLFGLRRRVVVVAAVIIEVSTTKCSVLRHALHAIPVVADSRLHNMHVHAHRHRNNLFVHISWTERKCIMYSVAYCAATALAFRQQSTRVKF